MKIWQENEIFDKFFQAFPSWRTKEKLKIQWKSFNIAQESKVETNGEVLIIEVSNYVAKPLESFIDELFQRLHSLNGRKAAFPLFAQLTHRWKSLSLVLGRAGIQIAGFATNESGKFAELVCLMLSLHVQLKLVSLSASRSHTRPATKLYNLITLCSALRFAEAIRKPNSSSRLLANWILPLQRTLCLTFTRWHDNAGSDFCSRITSRLKGFNAICWFRSVHQAPLMEMRIENSN